MTFLCRVYVDFMNSLCIVEKRLSVCISACLVIFYVELSGFCDFDAEIFLSGCCYFASTRTVIYTAMRTIMCAEMYVVNALRRRKTAESLAHSEFLLNFATLNETKNKIGYV